MIDCVGGRPDHVVVAVLANTGRRNMRRVFAGCRISVVAAGAVASDVRVVEVGGQPRGRRVAVVAVVAAADMACVFARGCDAVMAAAAGSNDLGVVNSERGNPSARAMAVLAKIRRLDVVGVLARRVESVVAAGTTTGNSCVVEYDGYPCRSRMAVVALLTRLRMPRRLAGGGNAVVAVAAAAFRRRVIHVGDRAPCRRGMAVRANIRGRDMIDGLCRSLHGAHRRVATDAGRIRSLESAAGVASLAGYIRVCSIEDKAGREMVERLLRARSRRDCCEHGHSREKKPGGARLVGTPHDRP